MVKPLFTALLLPLGVCSAWKYTMENNEAKSCKVGSGNICRVKTVQCPKIVNQNNILEVVPTYFGFRKWQTKK
jgi:hypothetical protein